ncbi:hypothetical protein MHBO_003511 [Bonamia ostreae]|uniref:Uncharacterized protein n=1 Tax=Bonamia ostreae TaxID=126728 RepID=A0ABV2AQS3_9EUKA
MLKIVLTMLIFSLQQQTIDINKLLSEGHYEQIKREYMEVDEETKKMYLSSLKSIRNAMNDSPMKTELTKFVDELENVSADLYENGDFGNFISIFSFIVFQI